MEGGCGRNSDEEDPEDHFVLDVRRRQEEVQIASNEGVLGEGDAQAQTEGVEGKGLVMRQFDSSVGGSISNVEYKVEVGGCGDAGESVEEVDDRGVGQNDGGSTQGQASGIIHGGVGSCEEGAEDEDGDDDEDVLREVLIVDLEVEEASGVKSSEAETEGSRAETGEETGGGAEESEEAEAEAEGSREVAGDMVE